MLISSCSILIRLIDWFYSVLFLRFFSVLFPWRFLISFWALWTSCIAWGFIPAPLLFLWFFTATWTRAATLHFSYYLSSIISSIGEAISAACTLFTGCTVFISFFDTCTRAAALHFLSYFLSLYFFGFWSSDSFRNHAFFFLTFGSWSYIFRLLLFIFIISVYHAALSTYFFLLSDNLVIMFRSKWYIISTSRQLI